jgi:hypothetical protein
MQQQQWFYILAAAQSKDIVSPGSQGYPFNLPKTGQVLRKQGTEWLK